MDGVKTVTLKGATIAQEFQRLIRDYVTSHYGDKLPAVQGRAWIDQTELRDRLLDAHRALMELRNNFV